MRAAVSDVLDVCEHPYGSRVNIIVTPGSHVSGVFGSSDTPTVVMIARALGPSVAPRDRSPIAVATFTGQRILPQFKTTAYITGLAGLTDAEAAGAHEAFYAEPDGRITEGVTSNIVARHGLTVTSPTQDTLPGITRSVLQSVATEAGLMWSENDLTRSSLLNADEVWICSSIRELVPVSMIDGVIAGNSDSASNNQDSETHDPAHNEQWFARLADGVHQRCCEQAAHEARTA